MSAPFDVSPVLWSESRETLRAVRRVVFIEEQSVPEALEWDDADETAEHVLAADCDGAAIGTGRLKEDCSIGRMAVLKAWRGRGVGKALLGALLEIARARGCDVVKLHAQTHAIGFYARLGFAATGDVFEEAGIPHRLMTLNLGSSPRWSRPQA